MVDVIALFCGGVHLAQDYGGHNLGAHNQVKKIICCLDRVGFTKLPLFPHLRFQEFGSRLSTRQGSQFKELPGHCRVMIRLGGDNAHQLAKALREDEVVNCCR